MLVRSALLAWVALVGCKAREPLAEKGAGEAFYIENVRLFDGERVLPRVTIAIRDGQILDVGEQLPVPAGAERVNADGQTLLPGLIDSHAHVWGPLHLQQALAFGTTTVVDLGDAPTRERPMRQRAATDNSLADLRFTSHLLTAPGGHGTEFGAVVPTVRDPNEAAVFVAVRVAEGADLIKLVYDDGHTYGRPQPTLSRETLQAGIAAAHAHAKLAVVHIVDEDAAREAIEAGADGLAHVFADRSLDPDLAALVASHHAFVIPTLSAIERAAGGSPGAALAHDPKLSPFLPAAAVASLLRPFPLVAGSPLRYAHAEQAVRGLAAAKVTLLAGTDAPNAGTSLGVSMHGELEHLVEAGLSATDALMAATSCPADRLGLQDRGRVIPGKRADLLLVAGDPTRDIRATRDILAIWRGGVRFDRERFVAQAKSTP